MRIEQEIILLQGGTTPAERRTLRKLASRTVEGEIVEVGSWVGGSTIFLADGAIKVNKKVYAVDPFPEGSYPVFLAHLEWAGVKESVVPIVTPSVEAAKTFGKPIGLLFIDAEHDYGNTHADFIAWRDKILDNGVIAFHDFWGGGVSRVIKEMLSTGKFSNVRFHGGLIWAEKKPATKWQMTKYRTLVSMLVAIGQTKTRLLRIRWIHRIEDTLQIQAKVKRMLSVGG